LIKVSQAQQRAVERNLFRHKKALSPIKIRDRAKIIKLATLETHANGNDIASFNRRLTVNKSVLFSVIFSMLLN